MASQKPFELILWNVRSRFNVGSLFRTSDAVGITTMHLCGYTPAPPHSRIEKVSLGAEKSVPFKQHGHITPLLYKLQKEGYEIVALELTPKSIPYFSYTKPRKPVAIIVGNEVDGLPVRVLNQCAHHIQIPMNGIKESLNVGVAFAIVAYHLTYCS